MGVNYLYFKEVIVKKLILKVLPIVLVVALGLSLTGCLDATDPRTDQIIKDVAALKTQVAEYAVDLEPEVSKLRTDLTALASKVSNLGSGASAADLASLRTSLESQITAVEDSLSLLGSEVQNLDLGAIQALLDNVESSISTLSDEVEDLSSQMGDIDELTNSLSSLNQAIVALGSAIGSLEARVSELEATTAPTTTNPTTTVPVVVRDISYEVIKYGNPTLLEGSQTLSYTFRLNVTNTGSVKLNDVGLVVNFWSNEKGNLTISPTTPKLTGSGTTLWNKTGDTYSGAGNCRMQFVSGWETLSPGSKLVLELGETKSFFLTLSASFSTEANSNCDFYLEVIEGYLY